MDYYFLRMIYMYLMVTTKLDPQKIKRKKINQNTKDTQQSQKRERERTREDERYKELKNNQK